MEGIQLCIPGIPPPTPKHKLKAFKHFHECLNYFKKTMPRKNRTSSEHGAYILGILEKEGVGLRTGNSYDFHGEDTRRLFNKYYAEEIIEKYQ